MSKKPKKISDTQLMEMELTDKEKRILAMRHPNGPTRGIAATYEEIGKVIFHGKISRQAVYELVKAIEQKQWRLNSRERYSKLETCPIDEMPLPRRLRNALRKAGYQKAGQIAGMSPEEFAQIKGIGQRQGAFLIYGLLQSWNLTKKPGSFCPHCGAPLDAKLKADENGIRCGNCGIRSFVRATVPPQPQTVSA